ncbi:hypothetical protein ACLOJK_017996 [Asimina triloba]
MSDLAACHATMLAADHCHGGRRIGRRPSPSPKWPNPIVCLLSVATSSPSFVEECCCPDLAAARAHIVIGEEARSCRCDGFFIRRSAVVDEEGRIRLPSVAMDTDLPSRRPSLPPSLPGRGSRWQPWLPT